MAEGGGLLNRYRTLKSYRGFESPSLRQLLHLTSELGLFTHRSGIAAGPGDYDVVVGDHPEEVLQNLGFSIELRSAQKIIGEHDAKGVEEARDARGFLQYHPPIPPEQLAGFSDGLVGPAYLAAQQLESPGR